MKAESISQEAGAVSESRRDGRARLAEYLAEQPPSRQRFDKFMKVVELIGVAAVAAYLGWAIYVSINWSVQGEIAAVWFGFMASIAGLLVLVGLHAAGLGAFFPLGVLASGQKLLTGSDAVGMGLGFAVTTLLVSAFWGTLAWGTWTANWSILIPMITIVAVVAGVGAIFAVASDLYKRFFRSR